MRTILKPPLTNLTVCISNFPLHLDDPISRIDSEMDLENQVIYPMWITNGLVAAFGQIHMYRNDGHGSSIYPFNDTKRIQ